MTWWQILLIYIAGAIFIGIPMGRKSLRVWNEVDYRGTGGFWGFVLFPLSAIEGEVGDVTGNFGMEISRINFLNPNDDLNDDPEDAAYHQRYIAFSAMFWLPRIIFNTIVLLTYGSLLTIAGISLLIVAGLPAFVAKLAKLVTA